MQTLGILFPSYHRVRKVKPIKCTAKDEGLQKPESTFVRSSHSN
jgi:hypothetical protein